jgi:two-component system NtrC family sensor kinase
LAHERLSAIGRLVSGVAHELNNPLAAVLYLSEDLRDDGSRSDAEREVLQVIADQARRCRVIVRDLLSFARGREQRFEPADGSLLLANAAAAAEPVLRESGARLQLRNPGALPMLEVDRSGIEQVLTNLIVNGAQAAGAGGTVTVEATTEAGGWRFAVEDTGPGIPAAVLPRIFEPFFTTKPQGEGTGLGLAVSLGIVERHGGALLVEPGGGGRGARFIVRIPGDTPVHPSAGPNGGGSQAVQRAAVPAGNGGPRSKPCVLVVDDERSLRLALGRFFQRQGWVVEEAEDGEVALALLAQAPADAFELVISDLRMPRRSGLEVHDWLAAHRPDLFSRLIIITGDLASPQVREFVGRTPRPVIEKPFELSILAEAVRSLRT